MGKKKRKVSQKSGEEDIVLDGDPSGTAVNYDSISHATTSSDENVIHEELQTNIRTLCIPSTSCQYVAMQHPTSITLHGYMLITVLFGSLHIFGYDVKENESVAVFSTEGTGLKKLVTLQLKRSFNINALHKKVLEIPCHPSEMAAFKQFINDIGFSSSVFISIKRLILPPPLQFLGIYYPSALQTRFVGIQPSEKENIESIISTDQSIYSIDLNQDIFFLSTEVNKVITDPDSVESGHRVLVFGGKNVGKSTLIRYLMNSSLNQKKEIYFLDTDPGATEFTPPGVLSLLQVTEPLFGPPFSHQKMPIKMFFTGSICPDASPSTYDLCVLKLMEFFENNHRKETLFVNTMGWVQGLGEVFLENIMNAVKPTIKIELLPTQPNVSLTKIVDENNVTTFKVPSKANKGSGPNSFSPADLRNFNIIAYFGQFLNPHLPITPINAFHPICINWNKLPLFVMNKKISTSHLAEALNRSIIALCYVDPSSIIKGDNETDPQTLTGEPLCECLGLAFVRASDEVNKRFYLITPIEVDRLKKVNSLVKGNIMVPEEIFLKQNIKNIPHPFVGNSTIIDTPGFEQVPKRTYLKRKK